MQAVEEKVNVLEKALQDFIYSVGIEYNKLINSQMRTEKELRDFKDEMKVFKDEMSDFKDEMKVFKDEAREINRDMNRKWGEMANKLGTITEDLVAPSLPRIIKEEFDLEVSDLIVRRKKKLKDGRVKEYDTIAIGGGYIFVSSAKSSLKNADAVKFVHDIKEFREFFPEFSDYKLIGVLASLYVDEGFVKHAEKKGFMVLSVGDQLMEVKNTKGFKPKEW